MGWHNAVFFELNNVIFDFKAKVSSKTIVDVINICQVFFM
jgi:hypothetical protein